MTIMRRNKIKNKISLHLNSDSYIFLIVRKEYKVKKVLSSTNSEKNNEWRKDLKEWRKNDVRILDNESGDSKN